MFECFYQFPPHNVPGCSTRDIGTMLTYEWMCWLDSKEYIMKIFETFYLFSTYSFPATRIRDTGKMLTNEWMCSLHSKQLIFSNLLFGICYFAVVVRINSMNILQSKLVRATRFKSSHSQQRRRGSFWNSLDVDSALLHYFMGTKNRGVMRISQALADQQ